MSGHSKLGASGCKRWMACPASIALAVGLPQAPTSKYAEEGTLAHELAEQMLRNFYSIGDSLIDKTIPALSFEPDSEMTQHVLKYCDFITDLTTSFVGNFQTLIEEKVHIEWVDQELWGTADCIVYDPEENHMHVFDLKYGEGIMVDAEENPQLLFYAAGCFMKFMPETITSYIIQPRANSGDTVKSWTYPASRIHEFEAELTEAVLQVDGYLNGAPDPGWEEPIGSSDVNPGDHCQFCPAKTICPKHLETFTDLTAALENQILPQELTKELMLKVMEVKKELLDWIKGIEEAALDRLLKGEEIEGLKLVRKRTNRTWKDEAKFIKKFGKRKTTVTKVMTPAQAEKAFSKSEVAHYATQEEGQPTLALESDKRKAIAPPALEMFENVEGEK